MFAKNKKKKKRRKKKELAYVLVYELCFAMKRKGGLKAKSTDVVFHKIGRLRSKEYSPLLMIYGIYLHAHADHLAIL